MSELDRAIGLDEVNVPPRHRPRFVLSRHRAALFIVLAYMGLVAFVATLLIALELLQNYNDSRNIDATLIFAGVMLIPFGWALANVYRRSQRPSWPT